MFRELKKKHTAYETRQCMKQNKNHHTCLEIRALWPLFTHSSVHLEQASQKQGSAHLCVCVRVCMCLCVTGTVF